jgi:RimJ/RimL family protein N-acetyltransferase
MNIIEIRTSRLHLRQWRDSDLEPFTQLNTDPRVMEFFPSTLNRQASDALALRLRDLISERGWGIWAVDLDTAFIGFVGLHVPDGSLPFSPCVEIAWRLAFDHWHKGYATEAATAALQVGFEQLRLPEIVSFTSVYNQRSQAVMQRLGMRRDNQTFQHPAVPAGNRLREHVLYRLSLQDWKNSSSRTTVTAP